MGQACRQHPHFSTASRVVCWGMHWAMVWEPPFEGLSSDLIYASFGRPTDIIANPPVEIFYCTDDTHMCFALAQVLSEHEGIEEEALIQAFAKGFDPKRGYGQGMRAT